ncbi:hypothetical protein BDV18DRAFT_161528 [Aspergillus unguis]
MRILWPLAWLAVAVSANLLKAGDSDAPLRLEERTPHLAKRSRSKCGPNLALANTARPSESTTSRNVTLGFIRFERNGTAAGSPPSSSNKINVSRLGKRMELPDKDLGVFYGYELPHVTELIVPDEDRETAEDMSTAVMKTFSSLGRRQQYSTGTAGLCGCTTMYIISRKAVYAAHWWESVSFDPDGVWREDGRTSDQLFQSTVLDMLTTGGRYHPKLDATLIEDSYIKAYLIRPTQTWQEEDGDVGYSERWKAIRTKVGELVPTLKDEARWTEIPYTALDESDDELDEDDGTAGKNLFKFDPLHIFESGPKGPLAMLWVEGRLEPYHEDKW